MPTVIRKSVSTLTEVRRDVLHAVSWQVQSGVWSPPTDMYETEDVCIVRVEIAGMREQDIDVVIDNQILTISGARTDISERRAYYQMEIRFGKFSTSLALPDSLDLDRATAEYKDGFLTVTFPKSNRDKVE